MQFGVHLPLIDLGRGSPSLDTLRACTEAARDLGYATLCANDHLVFQRSWLDGPTALAAMLPFSGEMRLATTVTLPVVRGPVPLAKTLAAIDRLSGGRLIAGLGPGSSARDYAIAGLDFEERWARFDEAVDVLRALWDVSAPPFEGKFYSSAGTVLEPYPVQQPPPIWIGSWGSDAGLRRVARLADGWLASGYNTNTEQFGRGLADLQSRLAAAGRSSDAFPNAIATMWTFVTDDAAEAERTVADLAGMLRREADELRPILPIGSPEQCAERLTAYAQAGAQQVFIWPLADEWRQVERFREQVIPLVEPSAPPAGA